MSYRILISVLKADRRTLLRDRFLIVVAIFTVLFLLGFGIAGIYRDALEITYIQPWVPYILIVFLISNTGTYGMLFGLVFIEEVETRVRAALMVLPINAAYLTITRTLTVVIWLIIQPFILVAGVALAWNAVPFGFIEWLMLCFVLSPLGAVFMVILSTIASNRVEALAVGKFFSIATTTPMLLYLFPAEAWYNHLFLVFPTTPIIHAYEAFRVHETGLAIAWLVGGFIYVMLLLAWATRRYIQKSYMVTA